MTTDDPHRANMPLTFGAEQLARSHPLAILLDDKGVLVGACANASRYGGHRKKLAEPMSTGTAVLVCPMCPRHYGVAESGILPAIKAGSPELTGAARFKDGTRTLTC